MPRDDDHYRRWPKPIRDEEIRQGLFLRNLSPPEERGRISPRARAVLAGPPADRGWPLSVCGSGLTRSAAPGRPVFLGDCLAFCTAQYNAPGREALLATPAAEIRLRLQQQPWEPQVPTAGPGAVTEDRWQLSREGFRSGSTNEAQS